MLDQIRNLSSEALAIVIGLGCYAISPLWFHYSTRLREVIAFERIAKALENWPKKGA